MKPSLIKNAIPQPIFNYIKDGITGLERSPSHLKYKMTSTNAKDPTRNLVAVVVPEDKEYLDYLSPLAAMVASYVGVDLNALIRIRVGITFNDGSENRIAAPHVDQVEPHVTALLYINDSDGDTILWDGLYKEGNEGTLSLEESGLTELITITPKENSLLIIGGNQYHSSSRPKKSPYRAVVNFNFAVDEWL